MTDLSSTRFPERLKILFLTNRCPLPVIDGQSRRTYNIVKGLSKNHEVYLLSLSENYPAKNRRDIQELKELCEGVEVVSGPSKKLSLPMIIRLICSLFSLEPYTVWRHYSREFKKRVVENLREHRFDLIHCDILPIAYTIRGRKAIPCVLTDHDISYLKTLRMAKNDRNPLMKVFLYLEALKLKRLESNIFRQVDLGITVSEYDKRHLSNLCPRGKFEVIENGVNPEEFTPKAESIEKMSLLWIGGFDHYPNKEAIHYFLDDIYPMVKKEISNIKLNLIGNCMSEKLLNYSGRDPSIKILGFVEDPRGYLSSAGIFISPILSGSGTRLKLLEAMAMKKAIVTTSIGCEGIEGEDGLHYLIADTAKKFGENIVKITRNPELRESLGQNARELVLRRYDWKKINSKMDEVYYRIVRAVKTKHGPVRGT